MRDIVHRRLGEFMTQLAELDGTCRLMSTALRRWRRMPDGVPYGEEICRLIESVGTPGLTFEPLEGRASTIQRMRRRVRNE